MTVTKKKNKKCHGFAVVLRSLVDYRYKPEAPEGPLSLSLCVSVVTIWSLKNPLSLSTTDLLMNKTTFSPVAILGWLSCLPPSLPRTHSSPFQRDLSCLSFLSVTPLVIAHLLCTSIHRHPLSSVPPRYPPL